MLDFETMQLLQPLTGSVHTEVFPLLVSINIATLFIAVVCELIVHTVFERCTCERFVVLKRFTLPDNVYVLFGYRCTVRYVEMRVRVFAYNFF